MLVFRISVLLLSFCFVCFVGGDEGLCFKESDKNCANGESRAHKYKEESNTKDSYYINQIEKAHQAYKECDGKNCNCHGNVITNDLKPFKNGITEEMLRNVKTKGTKYQIVDHKLYRDKECMFPARCSGIEYFILQVINDLPNMELIVNTRDWPQISKHYGPFGPVFSFSKTNEYYDIMYPAWAFWTGGPAIGLYPRGIGRWDLHRHQLSKKANETPWNNKHDKAFFRGSRTSAERDPLVLLSRKQPELADASYTKNQAWKSDADTLGAPPSPEASFAEHCDYKYLFNFRGVAASFRFKHILLCKSLVFHVGDEWLEFFYPTLKPWIHYVPLEANVAEGKIKELVQFFKKHDDLARRIAEAGYNEIWNRLRLKDVGCYWRKLLKKYGKLMKFEVVRDADLVEITG